MRARRPSPRHAPDRRSAASPAPAYPRHAATPPTRPGGDRATDRPTPHATPANRQSRRPPARGGGARQVVSAIGARPRSLDGSVRTSIESYRRPIATVVALSLIHISEPTRPY